MSSFRSSSLTSFSLRRLGVVALDLKPVLHYCVLGLLAYGLSLSLPSASLADDYVIGAGDTLHVSVWGNDELTRTVPVRPDGKISLPLLDDLQASGLSPTQLRDVITTKLKEYVNVPNVTVTVVGIKSYDVFVRGEVAQPGMHMLHKQMTLLHFISMVGGVTEQADLKRAYLLRNNQRMPVNFYELLIEGDLTQNLVLKPDDLIFIPDNFDQRVTVLGEVKTPQIIPFRDGLTILDAILMAGGFTKFARRNGTKIVRHNGDNTQEIPVKITNITNKGKVKENTLLKPGDTVLVPRSIF
jgi:polysaccharide export outer membrane protein